MVMQSRLGDCSLKFQVVCVQGGAAGLAALEGRRPQQVFIPPEWFAVFIVLVAIS